jgi:hypothetical protein
LSPRRLSLALLLASLVTVCAIAPASAGAARCNGVPHAGCLLPFPNDLTQTRSDHSSATGRRVALTLAEMPANASGVHIDPSQENRSDGFSPGEPIIVHVPSLGGQAAFVASKIVPVNNLAAYTLPRQPLLLLDETTGVRQIVWGELDANSVATASRNLIIHPGRNLAYGHRYVVVLRFLRDRAPAGLWRSTSPRLRAALRRAHVTQKSVYLTWDFTVASARSVTGRLLAIRNNAFAQLGDTNLADGIIQGHPPAYAITSVTDFTVAQNSSIARRVIGTFTVPCYLDQTGCPSGSSFHYSSRSPDALPTQIPGNVQQANFECDIPRAASSTPSRISLYGHGLLGSHSEVEAGNVQSMGQEHDFTFCATDWSGMASDDVPNAIALLKDLSKFSTLADRLQQGILNTLYLGRLLAHPQGLAANAAFQGPGGQKLLDISNEYFDGNSQGAIQGGVTTAVAPDWRRAVLGVATMDYATLLPRSTDFDTYNLFFAPAYPDEGTRLIALSIIQMLWDRGETDGYAALATSTPPPNTPSHTILMHVAVGDHQVANAMSDVEARTFGAAAYRPVVDPGRSNDVTPLFGVPTIPRFPWTGSAIVYWDGGPQTPPAPPQNVPNRAGADPHEFPRSTVAARTQKSDFLLPNGTVVDVCAGKPCHTDNFG